MSKWAGIFFFLSFTFFNAQAQRGYQKDSLQIKVYTVIDYQNSHPKKIDVGKVFCDYCNERQLALIKKKAWQLTYSARYSPENRIEEGKRKLALFIRVSKKDFSRLKDPEE